MCTHMSLGRTVVGSHTKFQCGCQSHLSYAWLDGVRKSAALWGNWRVRCWKTKNCMSNIVKDLEYLIFRVTGHSLFIFKQKCKKSRQTLLLDSFPALLSLLLCVCYLPGSGLCAGLSERRRHRPWPHGTQFLSEEADRTRTNYNAI